MANKKDNSAAITGSVLRAARAHFAYMGAFIVALVAFDSWNLITHEGIVQRWKAVVLLIIVITVVWYLSRGSRSGLQSKLLAKGLILADIIFAAYNVYLQRGMASKAVALFAVPIVTAAVLRSRRTVLATAVLSTAAYTFAAVAYFHQHYGEGYKVELYGEIFFYSATFFILAALLIAIIKPEKTKP